MDCLRIHPQNTAAHKSKAERSEVLIRLFRTVKRLESQIAESKNEYTAIPDDGVEISEIIYAPTHEVHSFCKYHRYTIPEMFSRFLPLIQDWTPPPPDYEEPRECATPFKIIITESYTHDETFTLIHLKPVRPTIYVY